MPSLPEIGKFVKHDPQRFVVGSLANQIKTLIQRMKMRGYKPWKVLLSPGLRYALKLENTPDYERHDLGGWFMKLPIVVDPSVNEPIIMINPEDRFWKLEEAQSTSEEVLWNAKKGRRNPNAVYQPKWRARSKNVNKGRGISKQVGLRKR